MDHELAKYLDISQRLKDGAVQLFGKINLALSAIAEPKPYGVADYVVTLDDVGQHSFTPMDQYVAVVGWFSQATKPPTIRRGASLSTQIRGSARVTRHRNAAMNSSTPTPACLSTPAIVPVLSSR
jgi:hypothetical protein